MRVLFNRLLTLSCLVGVTSTASALMWEDYDRIGKFLREGQSYSGTFDLTDPGIGFDPLSHTVTNARIGFSFSDGYRRGDRGHEWIDAWVETNQLWNNKEVGGTHRYGYHWIWRGLNGAMIADLQDGVLNYTVAVERVNDRWNNDVWLKEAKIKVWGHESPGHGVPDSGSTMVFLGIGLVAAIAFRKRLSKASS